MKSNFFVVTMCLLALLIVGCNRGPAESCDLLVEGITYEPKDVRVGDRVTFTYVVKNGGTATIPGGSYTVELLVDDERVTFNEHTSDLRPGGFGAMYTMEEGSCHFEATTSGEVSYRLVLTARDDLQETNESNNVVEGTIKISESADVSSKDAS